MTLRALPLLPLLTVTVALLCACCSDNATTATDAGPGEATDLPTCPPADATRCPPTTPAPNRALFTWLVADLQQLSGAAARKARVDAFLAAVAESGLYPPRDASTVVFLYRGTPPSVPAVVGSFNAWKPGVDTMTRLPQTDLYYLEKSLGQDRQEYKLATSAPRWSKDPLNEHVVWDGHAQGARALNSVIPPYGGVDPAGELRWHRVKSIQLGNTRDVFVYLPPAYLAESCATYPVLLINDGNEA